MFYQGTVFMKVEFVSGVDFRCGDIYNSYSLSYWYQNLINLVVVMTSFEMSHQSKELLLYRRRADSNTVIGRETEPKSKVIICCRSIFCSLEMDNKIWPKPI